ncbi:MAG: orotate phosphoribosyltransferase [Burkholderiaceae bacterium]|nr:orotate phosphoribosyltransferase [Burkholderiaceae bacterium]
MADDLRAEFIRFAVDGGVLRFGEFRTKAGRISPYFFDAGLFCDGASLGALAGFYARTLLAAERSGRVAFDMLFGPAYKGIPLASATAVALAQKGRNVGYAFNRKEAKDHGEGGTLIGAPLAGRVVIVDDVISAGTSVGESIDILRANGAIPAAVLIALDREERSGNATQIGERSAAQEVEHSHGIPVLAIAALDDLLRFLDSDDAQGRKLDGHRDRVAAYRSRYGAPADH